MPRSDGRASVQTYTETVRFPLHGHYLHRFFQKSDGKISGEYYSRNRLNTIVRDPGVVPPDGILVMEGVEQISAQKENSPPGWWQIAWDKSKAWLKSLVRTEVPGASVLTSPR